MHDALRVAAVAKAQGVSQFMDRFFNSPLMKKPCVRLKSIKFLPQSREGYDGHARGYTGLSEHEVELGDKEVHIGYAERPVEIVVTCNPHLFEDGCGMILVSPGIIGSHREWHHGAYFCHALKDLLEGCCDDLEYIGIYASHGYDKDPFHGIGAS